MMCGVEAIVSSAEEGDALPRSMGRWWSYGRRARMNVDLKRVAGRESAEGLADDDASSDLVH